MSTTSQAEGTPASRTRLQFPLSAKVLVLLAASLTLPALLLAHLTGALKDPLTASIMLRLGSGASTLAGVTVPNVQLLALGAIVTSLLVGIVLAHALFISRVRFALSFITALRAQGFQRIPVMPSLGSDEVGEMARQMGFATLEFQKMREETDSANDQRTLFLMTAAHQLRTPLSELLWSLEDLRARRASPEEKEHTLAAIDGTLRRMRVIMERLLSGAGVEEGRFGYVFEPLDVVPIIERIMGEFKPLCERCKVPVVFQRTDAVRVFADAERLSLVLFDLISNAINYTPAGGNVIVSVVPAGERLMVSVADSGIGIIESERQMLFTKFYRSERARHMHPDGSGLGLYLARTILERHGSDLLIDSQEGKGTKMTFYLHSKRENIPR